MRAVVADKGSATNRANSNENGLDKPKCLLTVAEFIRAPPGARMLPEWDVNRTGNQLKASKLWARVPQFNTILHFNFGKAAWSYVFSIASLFHTSCRRLPGHAVLCATYSAPDQSFRLLGVSGEFAVKFDCLLPC